MKSLLIALALMTGSDAMAMNASCGAKLVRFAEHFAARRLDVTPDSSRSTVEIVTSPRLGRFAKVLISDESGSVQRLVRVRFQDRGCVVVAYAAHQSEAE